MGECIAEWQYHSLWMSKPLRNPTFQSVYFIFLICFLSMHVICKHTHECVLNNIQGREKRSFPSPISSLVHHTSCWEDTHAQLVWPVSYRPLSLVLHACGMVSHVITLCMRYGNLHFSPLSGSPLYARTFLILLSVVSYSMTGRYLWMGISGVSKFFLI